VASAVGANHAVDQKPGPLEFAIGALAQLHSDGTGGPSMTDTTHRIYTTSVASVYVHYVAKAERKGRTKAEVDEILR
jgi:Uncharacterized protein conserved in bacteria (DUF2200)